MKEFGGVGTLASHDFMGKDGFLWFVGMIEDVKDPLKLGRARVRAFGHHTLNRKQLPVEDLPWAHCLAPLNNPSAPKAPLNGVFVLGFFLDGAMGQQPVLLGSINGFRDQELMAP